MRLLIATALLLHAGTAIADDTAGTALARGNAALEAGRIHEACEAFASALALESSIETELRLASCYEQDGKPVAAAHLYRNVVERDTNAARRQRSLAKASKLEANAPKLRFAIHPRPPGLVIEVDGVEVPADADVLVDQGPHEVIATAPGFAGRASAPIDRDRVIVDVIIRMEPVAEPPKPAAPMPAAAPVAQQQPAAPMPAVIEQPMTPPADHRRRNGLFVAGGGLAMLVGAAVVFSLSSDRFDEEHALCPMSQCANQADLDKANALLSDGRTLRGVSIGMGIGGGLLLAAGTYLALTPNRHAARVSVQLQPGGGSVGYTARF